jgi:hypothetical protein
MNNCIYCKNPISKNLIACRKCIAKHGNPCWKCGITVGVWQSTHDPSVSEGAYICNFCTSKIAQEQREAELELFQNDWRERKDLKKTYTDEELDKAVEYDLYDLFNDFVSPTVYRALEDPDMQKRFTEVRNTIVDLIGEYREEIKYQERLRTV